MRLGSAVVLAALGIAMASGPRLHAEALQSPGAASPQPARTDGDAAALAAFRASIDTYLGLRKKISQEIPPLKVTPRAAEITAASDALARAVQRARPRAAQGSFFTPDVAAMLRRRLEQVLRTTDREAVFALITEEPSATKRPTVHMRFPAGDVLATTPAVFLETLPPLPSELEYRFVGTTLVLRDIAAALILDYLPDAIKAR